MIIGVTGYQCSGKSVASKILRKKGHKVYHMHDAVIEEVKRRGLEITAKNMGSVAEEIRKNYSKGYIASKIVARIKINQKACIDGIRDNHEVGIFRSAFGKKFVLIAVKSRKSTRFNRALERKRADDALSKKAFYEKDAREKSWGLDEAIRIADYKIQNEGTQQELEGKIKKTIKEIEKTK